MSNKEKRLASYDVFHDHGLNSAMGGKIREWAREKGFEEDVDELHEAVNEAGVEEVYFSDQDREKMHATIYRLFTLAQVGLIVSELGEFVEAVRKPGPDDKVPQHSAQKAELADTIIRILHLDNRIDGAPIDQVIADKMLVNEGRGHKHGKLA